MTPRLIMKCRKCMYWRPPKSKEIAKPLVDFEVWPTHCGDLMSLEAPKLKKINGKLLGFKGG
jgi:hypothetical protein